MWYIESYRNILSSFKGSLESAAVWISHLEEECNGFDVQEKELDVESAGMETLFSTILRRFLS